MKRVFIVELGTESSTGALDDLRQWEFHDLDAAITFYNGIDLHHEWVRELDARRGASRDSVVAKQIVDRRTFNAFGYANEYERVLLFDEYGNAEFRMEG